VSQSYLFSTSRSDDLSRRHTWRPVFRRRCCRVSQPISWQRCVTVRFCVSAHDAGSHRFIAIWAVVVQNRVFVHSWSVKPDGWYHAFLADSSGTIRLGDWNIAVKAVRNRGKCILDAIDGAYLEKYNTPGGIKYLRRTGTPRKEGQEPWLLLCLPVCTAAIHRRGLCPP
jgi:hypothetical protein